MATEPMVADQERADALARYLADPAARDEPFELLGEARSDGHGVFQASDGTWLILGHDAVQSLLRDPRVSRWQVAVKEVGLDEAKDPELRDALNANLKMANNYDEPDHSRLRRLMRLAFLPGSIEEWRPRSQEIARQLVDKAINQPKIDFVREIAYPLPEMVMCELLGVPHDDHRLWSQWSADVVSNNRASSTEDSTLGPAQAGILSFHRYMKDLIARRRAALSDDMASTLIRAEIDGGDQLTEDELIGQLVALVQAGHETTANLVTNGMYILLHDRGLYRQLVDNPDLVPEAVQEFLRLDGPAPFTLPRVATADIEYRGTHIPAGSRMMIVLQAANRDPEVFPDPDAAQLGRRNVAQHLAFGHGIHICIGRHLAQLEAESIFREIVTRLPDLELVGEAKRARSYTRGWAVLDVRRRGG